MATITNFVTSASINTATDMLATRNNFGHIRVVNLHATADIYVNLGADAASTGTVAGVLIPAKDSMVLPVVGQRVSVASGTASVPVSYHEELN